MKKFFTQTILLVVALLAGTSAKAVSYKIDGPETLTTFATYKIVTDNGSALPSGLTASWDYPSDFYRIGYTNTTIELGRKQAIGTYTLSARLSNGSYVSKTIIAKEPEPKPDPDPDPEPIPDQTAQSIYVQPIEVSKYYDGPYEDIMQYRPYTGKYYFMFTHNLNVKFSIKNKTNKAITLNSESFEINYGTKNLYNVLSITKESYTAISSFTIPANETIDVIFHFGNEWYDNRENANFPDLYQPVRLFLYYNGTKTDGISYSYLFSRTERNKIAVSPTVVTSDVTVKSTDDSAIKSVKIVGTMGDLVKTRSYNGNCTEAQFDLSNCKNGIYYIQVEKTNGIETAKIIKK
ncbi:T9SS type A sorting domain-containing protein [Parabacteroides goldsteinii]|uniref:T9SS type A sorting domain-containing protein n=1 Tax=Parabacteroides goldsteinii TaxID=328812 RepID=UPI001CCB1A4B|nr:T9SS type A sorting domain-containing protein [Parabacteroides goldsteinii]UBD73289.1 T9SS type A sorting domain-containing protein [Parabacteroides goldsteinii]